MKFKRIWVGIFILLYACNFGGHPRSSPSHSPSQTVSSAPVITHALEDGIPPNEDPALPPKARQAPPPRGETLSTGTVHNGWSVCPRQSTVLIWGHNESVHPQSVIAWRVVSFITQKESAYGRSLASSSTSNAFTLQTYNCRFIGGTHIHSEHAHALASDVRPGSNPLRTDGVLITDFDRFGDADALAFLAGYLRMGFRSGINWCNPITSGVPFCLADLKRSLANEGHRVRNGRVDSMHLELMYSPSGLAKAITLHEGETKDPVWLMEDRLAALGYDNASHDFDINKFFGAKTKEAVIDFQNKHHLTADGVVGLKTWGALWG